ncbi:MAG: bifunctional demethylmenaquinone methyltransferase/2-methoxy-6-polyprenyl-1,4-benzoquinol methylase UbiE [Bacteroidales bacterium]|nr:bifunctional demethylmenaquinone methyltransferase/2-methoxy-6-polyprenyl-1,4-benzoquinol methylase UbiE [Bacteroidales bacterium]
MSVEKGNIGALFNRIAGSYDKLNHLLSLGIDRRWRRRAVDNLKYSGKVLDVAIGTADLALEIMHKGKADMVTGIDLSDEMMRIGAEKVERLGYGGKIVFEKANALDMPYPDESFDTVTCAFGVRNFSDLDKGLSEMYRVMKKGGQLCIIELSYPENKLVAAIYDFYFSMILPKIGGAISNDKPAYTYLNKSVKHFIWGEKMKERLQAAGFKYVGYRPMTFGIATLYMAGK